MKFILPLFFSIILIASCSQKKGATSSFKLVVGQAALVIPMYGGAYLETEERSTKSKSLIKLDAENSAFIPFGTYDMTFVTFSGPAAKSGNMYCGSVYNAPLLSPSATIDVTITMAECSQSQYTDLIAKILNNQNSLWDTANFDQGQWGP